MYNIFVYMWDLFGFDGDLGLAKFRDEEVVLHFKEKLC